MFSKALYKQSWKANWIQWLAVAVVSSFILIIIMLMSGGDGLGSLTSSFTETFVKDSLESNFQNTAINYHYISNDSLEDFDRAFLDQYILEVKNNPFQEPSEENIANAYEFAINEYVNSVDIKIKKIDDSYTEENDSYAELMAGAMFALNPNGIMNDLYEDYEIGSSPLDYDIMTLVLSIDSDQMMAIWMGGDNPPDLYDISQSLERKEYRLNRSRNASAIFLAGNMSSDKAKQAILASLSEANITEEIYDSFGFDYQALKDLSNEAILGFQARLDFEISELDINDFSDEDAYLAKISEIKTKVQESITATLHTLLPSQLATSMTDMQDYDVYTMTVGNMYFKIVGLLISVVYIIMVGVNLIAGQVDSGSMAYILSTGTKRNAVTITQMIFFVSSTFLLYVLSAIVSVICYQIAPPTLTKVTIGKLLLFNLGAFLVTMTLGSIIYLASCIFNKSRRAMALGGGFAVLTLVFTILGMFASDSTPAMMRMEALSVFNNVSLVTLFDINSIIDGTAAYIWKFGILGFITVICFIVGINIFKKKDLPL